MKLLFATSNNGKLREAGEILGEGYTLISPAMLGVFDDVPETGDTLSANSVQKALYMYKRCGMDCFADDTGLEVDALGGAPGVHTARYAGEGHDFNACMDKLLHELEGVPGPERTARFRCVVTLITGGEQHQFEGRLEGRIATAKSGRGGFGYDPVFIPDAWPDRTLADVSEEDKNAISHRGEALRAMAAWLSSEPPCQMTSLAE